MCWYFGCYVEKGGLELVRIYIIIGWLSWFYKKSCYY